MKIFDDYLEYTIHSESPEAFHKWTCLSMISGIVGKKCWIKFNYFTVYPNLYLILVSLPGVGKKSTALRIGEAMVKESEADIVIQYDSLTPQALMIELDESYRMIETPSKKMFGSSSMTVFASELVTLLGGGPGMVEFLTDIYDSGKSFEYKTKGAGKLEIKSPCLNVMGCVTTDIFANKILQDAVAGGFISRSIVVYANKRKAISPFEMPPPEAIKARQRVIDRLSAVKDLFGEVVFTNEAKDVVETWYDKEFNPKDDVQKNLEFNSRKHAHVAKTAMLLALSDLTTIIDVKHLDEAIDLMDEVEHYMKLVHMSAGAAEHSETLLKILSTINTYGKVDEVDILTLFLGDTSLEKFTEQIELMIRVQYITLVMEGNKRFFKITPKGSELFMNYNR